MTQYIERMGILVAAAIAVQAASAAQAQVADPPNIYWQGTGVTGNLTDANYTPDGVVMNLNATSADEVFFGGGGMGTLSGSGTLEFGRLRIGHNETIGAGQGDVTVSGGAQLNMILGDSGTANSGLTVGNVQRGSLTIDGPGSSVTSNRLIVIGTATNQPNRNGTINVTNGGALIAADGNINLGVGTTGMQGRLNVDGSVQVNGPGADLNIGLSNTTSTMTLTNGSVDVNDVVEIATAASGVNNHSSLTMSGGTFTNGGNFFVGRGASTGATLNLSGGELSVGARFLMGGGSATGIVVNHSGGILNTATDVRVADANDAANPNVLTDATYNLSGTGIINSTAGGIVGRQGTGKFFQTGGEANFLDALAIGKREAAVNPTNGLYKISAGVLNAGAMIGTTALDVAPNGTGQFRVVGDDAAINLFGNALVSSTADGTGTLAFELEAGDLLSTINVTDAATFGPGSKLVLDATNALPSQTSYNVLTAASITLDPGLVFEGPAGWNYEIVDGGATKTLRVFGPLIAEDNADFDADGDVDGVDFLAWQRGFGGTATRANGNANGDGAVNAQDFAIWSEQFGATGLGPAAAIPEPGSFGLALICLATFAARARRATHGA